MTKAYIIAHRKEKQVIQVAGPYKTFEGVFNQYRKMKDKELEILESDGWKESRMWRAIRDGKKEV